MSAAPEEPSRFPKQGGSDAANNLYLVTFLAMLFLLLVFTCGIVVQSYLIRRRIMRRMEEAPANQNTRARTRKRRPKFYDRWIAPATNNSWENIMPLSLRVVFGKRPHNLPGETKKSTISWRSTVHSRTATASHLGDTYSSSPKFEIVQVTVLIEMPSPFRSKLNGHATSKSPDDDHDDQDQLPELAIGYARCYKH